MKRNATAVWNGSGKEGGGNLTTQSTVLNKTQYSWKSRFEEGPGTNPEELIAAAHAGCFTMKVAFLMGAINLTPETLETKCVITLDNGAITKSELHITGKVPGVTAEQFKQNVETAAATCIVSNVLKCEITVEATLI